MTQFALARSRKQINGLTSLAEVEDGFLSRVAFELFPAVSLNEIYRFDFGGKDIDSLMIDAQKAVIDKNSFQETALYKAVKAVAENVDDFVFWYGADYDELSYIYDVSVLLRKLEDAVSDSFCEIYIHYKKAV